MSKQMTGAQAAVAQLLAEGVDTVLGIPGVHNLPICDALLDHPQLRFLHGRHEQGIAFMANGYARANNRIAVSLVITGPGVTNSLTPLADAYLDSVPMVLIAASVEPERAGKGAFHELRDQTGVLRAVTKWTALAGSVEEVPEAIHAAFVEAYGGRPGPTAVEIPLSVQRASGQVDVHPAARPPRQAAPPEAVGEAARQLARAAAPLVFVGRGAVLSGASGEVLELIEALNAPCFTTPLAKGVVPEDHPLSLSWGGVHNGLVHELVAEADLILVVGSSLDEADGRRYGLALADKLIQIDTCPEVIGRTWPVRLGLVGDAQAVLAQLLEALSGMERAQHPSPAPRITARRAQALDEVQGRPIWRYMDAIERALPRDAFVANDGSRVNSWANAFLRRYQPNTYAVTRNTAALGFAFPAAVGAKIAHPEREALAIAGDGGFLFTIFSLATAVQHRLGAIAVVFNDQGYGTIAWLQRRQFGRVIGAALRNPDYVRLAEAFGAHGCHVETPEELYDAITTVQGRNLPTVIEVPLEGDVGFA